MKYDPYTHTNSDEWLTLDETERGILVEDYHERNHNISMYRM